MYLSPQNNDLHKLAMYYFISRIDGEVLLELRNCNDVLHCSTCNSTQGQSEYEDCATNYFVFENAVFKTSNNLFELTTTFYPADKYNPLYVNVMYRFLDTNTSVNYQWSSASLYHVIQPRTLRYFSILFCYIEDNRIVDLELELPGECESLKFKCSNNASNFLFVITQRVNTMYNLPLS